MIDYAENNDNKSGSEVRSALSFYYDINVDDPEALRQSSYHKWNPQGESVKMIKPEFIFKDFTIYPNPSKNELIINAPQGINEDKWNVKIIDLDGRMVNEYFYVGSTFKVGINEISTGILVVQLSGSKGNVFTKRIQVIK